MSSLRRVQDGVVGHLALKPCIDVTGLLAKATAQILLVRVLHSNADLMAPLAESQVWARRFATVGAHILRGVDHQPWLRAPRECLKHIEQWLSKLREQAP